jgi:hypothetical protein
MAKNMKQISINQCTGYGMLNLYRAIRDHGVVRKTSLPKLLGEKKGSGEHGGFYGLSHQLKHLHFWTLNIYAVLG